MTEYPRLMSQNNPNHLRAGRYTRGFLPHIRVEGRPYFVTFRLAGTLPQGVLGRFKAERELLIEKLCHSGPQPSSDDRKRLDERHSEKLESYLDAGYGDCWLKDLRIAELVANALKFFDGQRYELSAWVIMPNHVQWE